MATDIKISELNEITQNSDFNQVIVNDRESSGDSGITKRINLDNFLTPGLVKTDNIANLNITTDKLNTNAVTFDKIATKTITCDQIANGTISNILIGDSAVDNRALDHTDNYTMSRLIATTSLQAPQIAATSKLTVNTGCVKLNGLDYVFPSTQVPQFFLRTDGAGNLSWQEAVPGSGTSLVFDQIFPVGTIIPYGGSASVPNDQWLALDGSNNGRFDGVAYPALSAALGTTWGDRYTSSGGTTVDNTNGRYFSLPNMSGRVPIGQGTGTDLNGTSCTFTAGGTSGIYCNTLVANNIPSHTHCYRNDYFIEIYSNCKCVDYIESVGSNLHGSGRSDNDNKFVYGRCCTTSPNATTTSPFSIQQPVAHTRYIIKAKPDHIQQFAMTVGPGISATDGLGAQTNTIDLSSTEIGLKIDNTNIKLDGSNKITLVDNVSASSIRFDDGTVQSTANLIIAGSVKSTGEVRTGTGFTSTRISKGRYRLTFPEAATYVIVASNITNDITPGFGASTSFDPKSPEIFNQTDTTVDIKIAVGGVKSHYSEQMIDSPFMFYAIKV